MKKTLLSILICFMITSCYPTQAPSIFIGMSVEEFTVKTKYEELVTMDGEWMVYKVIY